MGHSWLLHFWMLFIVLFMFLWEVGSSSQNQGRVLLTSIPWRGHVNPLRSLATELIRKGFTVTFALPDECEDWVIDDGVNFVGIGNTAEVSREWHEKDVRPGETWYEEVVNPMGTTEALLYTLHEYRKRMVYKLQNHFKKHTYNLIVIDRYTLAGYDAVKEAKTQYIINNPFFLMDLDLPHYHLPSPLSLIPHYPETMYERVLNFFHRIRYRTEMQTLAKFDKDEKDPNGNPLPEMHTAMGMNGINVVITNTAFGLEYTRPMTPRFHLVGVLTAYVPKFLGNRLSVWLQNCIRDDKPAVYVNLGADHRVNNVSAHALLEGLLKAGTRVVWSMPASKRHVLPKTLPSTVWWNSFLPQEAVLAHKAVSLFVSHGGLTGVQEALWYKKPVLIVPSYIDQWEVAYRVKNTGAGIILNKWNMSVEMVRERTVDMLTNKSYTKAATELSAALHYHGGASRAGTICELTYFVGQKHTIPTYMLQDETTVSWYAWLMPFSTSITLICICMFAATVSLARGELQSLC